MLGPMIKALETGTQTVGGADLQMWAADAMFLEDGLGVCLCYFVMPFLCWWSDTLPKKLLKHKRSRPFKSGGCSCVFGTWFFVTGFGCVSSRGVWMSECRHFMWFFWA